MDLHFNIKNFHFSMGYSIFYTSIYMKNKISTIGKWIRL